MSNRAFTERLHRELDAIGVPERSSERTEALSKLIKIPRFKAEAILSGNLLPDAEHLELLATELEVSVDWLLGKEDSP